MKRPASSPLAADDPSRRALLEAVERASRAAMAAVDEAGMQTYVNPAFCALVGWSAEELVGCHPPFPYWPPESLEGVQRAFELTMAGRAPEDGFELRLMHRSGRRIEAQLLIAPMLDGDGRRVGFLASVYDVTERKQREQAREQDARAQAERAALETSRQRLEAVLDHLPVGVMLAEAPSGGAVYSNLAAQQIFGGPIARPRERTEYERTFRAWDTDGHPLSSDEFPLVRALSGERVDGQEVVFERPDGTTAVVRASAAAITDATGSIVAAVTAYYDITDRQRADAELRASEARLQAILDSSPSAIYLKDTDGRFVLVNREFERLAARPRATLLMSTDTDLFGADVAARFREEDRQVLAGGEAREFEETFSYDGVERTFATVKFPVRDGANQIRALGGISTEITARKRLENALRLSERRFRTLAEATSEMVWTTGADGLVREDSPSWRAFTGQTEPGWLSHPWAAIHPDDAEVFHRAFREARARSSSFEVDVRLRGRDGSYTPMAVRAAPVYGDDGSVREWVGANIDISVRRQQEGERQALLDSEQSARREAEAARHRMALLDRITAALLVDLKASGLQKLAREVVPLVADWCVIYGKRDDGQIDVVALAHADVARANAAWEFLRRYPLDPAVGWGVARVLRTGESELIAEVGDDLLRSASADDEHLAHLRAFGTRSHICVPLRAGDAVIGSLSFAMAESGRTLSRADLVLAEEIAVRAALALEHALLYAEAEQARRAAESANRAKDEFLAVLGHELRNPLAPILTALELIRMRSPDAFARETMIVARQVRHMARLVDDLLDVSRIVRGTTVLRHERLALAQVIAHAIEMARPLLQERAHEVTVELAPAPVFVNGDSDRLAQVFANILLNAAKYTPPRGRVTLTAQVERDEAIVRIRDSGPGIPESVRPRLFQPFTQGPQSLERAQGGLGLGLAIVHSLVRQHGGTVAASLLPAGAGAELVVRLPTAVGSPSSHPQAVVETVAARHARVLVVDDNEDARVLLDEALQLLGYQVELAADGPSALDRASSFEPEVALVDIGLPVMDGYEVAARLREKHGDRLRLIAVTGYGQEGDRRRAIAAGFDEHMVKPVEIQALDRTIDLLLRGAQRL